jgi:hypothetical protein
VNDRLGVTDSGKGSSGGGAGAAGGRRVDVGGERGGVGGWRRNHLCRAHSQATAVGARLRAAQAAQAGAGGTRRSGRGGQRACGRCLETAGDNTFQSLLARRLLLWLVVVCCGLRGVELVVGRAALVVVCNKADAGYPWECPRPLRARDSPPWSSLCTAVARRLASSGVLAARGVQDGGACACVRACPGLLSYPRKHCLESNQIQSDLILAIVA